MFYLLDKRVGQQTCNLRIYQLILSISQRLLSHTIARIGAAYLSVINWSWFNRKAARRILEKVALASCKNTRPDCIRSAYLKWFTWLSHTRAREQKSWQKTSPPLFGPLSIERKSRSVHDLYKSSLQNLRPRCLTNVIIMSLFDKHSDLINVKKAKNSRYNFIF